MELKNEMDALAEKDKLFEETRRNLFKKRCLLMKAEEKGLDSAMQSTLLRKAEKDYTKSLQIIDEKIAIEERLISLVRPLLEFFMATFIICCLKVQGHLQRMEKEMEKSLNLSFRSQHDNFIADVPDSTEAASHTTATGSTAMNSASRSSPKKRQALNDSEPIDPDEPVYCFCSQVSFGDMIACDNPNCEREWFHYPCVGLTSPPKGKWYCKECEPLMKLAGH